MRFLGWGTCSERITRKRRTLIFCWRAFDTKERCMSLLNILSCFTRKFIAMGWRFTNDSFCGYLRWHFEWIWVPKLRPGLCEAMVKLRKPRMRIHHGSVMTCFLFLQSYVSTYLHLWPHSHLNNGSRYCYWSLYRHVWPILNTVVNKWGFIKAGCWTEPAILYSFTIFDRISLHNKGWIRLL